MLAPRPAPPSARSRPAGRAGRRRSESSPLPRALRAILGRGGAPRPSPAARCEGGCSASPHARAPSPTRGLKRCSGSARPRRGTVREIEPRAAGRARHVGLRFRGGAWGGVRSVVGNVALEKVGVPVCGGMQGCETSRGKEGCGQRRGICFQHGEALC